MSLTETLKAGVKNIKQTVWPGTGDKIGIRVLSEAETQRAAFETERLFKKHGIEFSQGTADAYQAEMNTQTLALALLDDQGKPLFKDANELRPLLTAPVKDLLIEELNAWQDSCSPSLETLTEKEYEKLFDEVKKNPSITNSFNFRTLSGLVTYLASPRPDSPPDNGSTSG